MLWDVKEADAEYVLALKGNQGQMHEEIKMYLEDAVDHHLDSLAHDYFETMEKDHGRIETRRYWVTEEINWLEDLKLWEGLKSACMVESVREIKGVKTTERRFYISSLPSDAKKLNYAVRGHWAIENQLHWTLDICFGEDQSQIRSQISAQNFNMLRQIALSTLKRDTRTTRGIQRKQKLASWDNDYLLSLIKI